MDHKKGAKKRRSGSDGYWEKYFITVGGISPDWDCYALRDFVKPITERIWVDVNPYHLENPPRVGQVGAITVNGREDAERLYLILLHYQWPDGHYFSVHLWNITNNDSKYVRCNCDSFRLASLCPAEALSVYMRTQAPTRSYGPMSMDTMSHVPHSSPCVHVENTFLAVAGQVGHQSPPPLLHSHSPVQHQFKPHEQHQQLVHHNQQPQLQFSPYALALRQPATANCYNLNWNHIPVIPTNGAHETEYRAIRITHMHWDATKEHLQTMFRDGGLNPIHVNMGKRGRTRQGGTAVAVFSSLSEAVRAINCFNGHQVLGRRIIVEHHQNGNDLVQTALAAGLATSGGSSTTSAESIADASSTTSEFSEQSSSSVSPPIVNGSQV